MADVPHLRIPFRFGPDGSAEVVEQNSHDEIAQCVAVLLKTRQGERIEVPAYGIPDQTFVSETQVPIGAIEAAVEQWEPRAEVEVSTRPSFSDDNARDMRVAVRVRSDGNGADPTVLTVSTL